MGSSRLSRIPDPKSPSCRGGPVCPPSGAQPCAPTRLSQNIIDRQGRRSLPKKAKMGDCRSRLHSHPRPWGALRRYDANSPVSPFRKGGGKRARPVVPYRTIVIASAARQSPKLRGLPVGPASCRSSPIGRLEACPTTRSSQ